MCALPPVKKRNPNRRHLKRPSSDQNPDAMGTKLLQLLTCALLFAGGAALLLWGYPMGGITAVALAAVLGLISLSTPTR
jgi:hypothetical protein